jgi:hypothetical protein
MPSRPSESPKPSPITTSPDRIVGEREAAQLRGVSPDTLRRIAIATGRPRRMQLSPRRVGYRLSEVLDI